jgi:hypothetical protein
MRVGLSFFLVHFRVEKTVHVHDKIAHMGIVHGPLRGPFPGIVGAGVVRIHANDIKLIQILELDVSQVR